MISLENSFRRKGNRQHRNGLLVILHRSCLFSLSETLVGSLSFFCLNYSAVPRRYRSKRCFEEITEWCSQWRPDSLGFYPITYKSVPVLREVFVLKWWPFFQDNYPSVALTIKKLFLLAVDWAQRYSYYLLCRSVYVIVPDYNNPSTLNPS